MPFSAPTTPANPPPGTASAPKLTRSIPCSLAVCKSWLLVALTSRHGRVDHGCPHSLHLARDIDRHLAVKRGAVDQEGVGSALVADAFQPLEQSELIEVDGLDLVG